MHFAFGNSSWGESFVAYCRLAFSLSVDCANAFSIFFGATAEAKFRANRPQLLQSPLPMVSGDIPRQFECLSQPRDFTGAMRTTFCVPHTSRASAFASAEQWQIVFIFARNANARLKWEIIETPFASQSARQMSKPRSKYHINAIITILKREIVGEQALEIMSGATKRLFFSSV